MFWVLLVHIGVPLMFGLAFAVFRTLSSAHTPTWDVSVDTALDLAILGIGATAAIFENEKVAQTFGQHEGAVELSVVGASFLCTSVIVSLKRYIIPSPRHQSPTRQFVLSIISIDVGCLALYITSSVLAYAYYPAVRSDRLPLIIGGAVCAATLAATILTGFVSLIISSTPLPERIAESPKIRELLRRSIVEIYDRKTVNLDELIVAAKIKRRPDTE